MKKNLAVTVAVTLTMMAVPAFAQYSGPMKVTIPFNFVVENDRLQAGDYTVQWIATGRLRIHTPDGSVSTTFLAIPTESKTTSEKGHFVFRQYGSEYFLTRIWTPGQNVGWDVFEGKLEMELARKKATSFAQTTTLWGH